MKLVKYSDFLGPHYLNMDFVTDVYEQEGNFFVTLLGNEDSMRISEEAYKTILIYGNASSL